MSPEDFPYGLFPEKLFPHQRPSRDIPREEVKEAMEKVLSFVEREVENAYPGHAGMTKEEIIEWVKLRYTFMAPANVLEQDYSIEVSCAVLLLFISWERYKVKDLFRFIDTARFIYTSGSNAVRDNYTFTSLINPLITSIYSV